MLGKVHHLNAKVEVELGFFFTKLWWSCKPIWYSTLTSLQPFARHFGSGKWSFKQLRNAHHELSTTQKNENIEYRIALWELTYPLPSHLFFFHVLVLVIWGFLVQGHHVYGNTTFSKSMSRLRETCSDMPLICLNIYIFCRKIQRTVIAGSKSLPQYHRVNQTSDWSWICLCDAWEKAPQTLSRWWFPLVESVKNNTKNNEKKIASISTASPREPFLGVITLLQGL